MALLAMKHDLDSPEHIQEFVDSFYDKVLKDELLKPIFIDVAGIDLSVHKPFIRQYWEKLLLGHTDYKRHTMNIHRAIHAKMPLTQEAFDRWLSLFKTTAEREFEGPKAQRAVQIATSIADNMNESLHKYQ